MKLREAQAATLGLFLLENKQMQSTVSTERGSYLKDYLFIAILISFIMYKLPGNSGLSTGETIKLNLIPFQEKQTLIDNSILQSGIRLLDIKLELESTILAKSSDLVSRTRFDSFGNVPTLINLDYVITDTKGRELYREIDEVTVETEKTITKDFAKLNLKKGTYFLTLTTLYNSDIKDEFRQRFEVQGLSTVEIVSWVVLGLGIAVASGSIIYHFTRTKSNGQVLNLRA